MESSAPTSKWYDKTWLVILLCILFFPVGLYALWMNNSIPKGWKIGVSVFFAFVTYSVWNDSPEDKAKRLQAADQSAQLITLKDSLSKIEKEKQAALAEQELKAKQKKEVEENNYSAYDIAKAFEDNEIAADEQYKNKEFYITGPIEDFNKGPFEGVYVNIKGKGFFPIQCKFNSDQKAALSQLSKGTTITLKGKCVGKILGGVSFEDCTLY